MKYVDLDKPLSHEDREFLILWGRVLDVQKNEARFGALSDEEKSAVSNQVDEDRETDRKRFTIDGEPSDFDEDLIELVENLDTGEIRAGLDKAQLDHSGELDAIQERLLNHLQDERDQGK